MNLSPESIAACKVVFGLHRNRVLELIDAVAAETGIPAKQIRGRCRKAHIVRARQIVMYEARQLGLSLLQIADAMGRDHTTIMHGIRAEQARRG